LHNSFFGSKKAGLSEIALDSLGLRFGSQSLRANRSLYSPDGLMPEDGPPNVLRSLSLVDEKIANSKVNLKQTYDNTFVLKGR